MVQNKVQLKQEDVAFIEKACHLFNYKNKSEYMRSAILEKIKNDKKELRELKRKKAMEGYCKGKVKDVFGTDQGLGTQTDRKFRARNVELALGIGEGQYRRGLEQDQASIDKAFRL